MLQQRGNGQLGDAKTCRRKLRKMTATPKSQNNNPGGKRFGAEALAVYQAERADIVRFV